jgi:hypothetical protein
MLGVCLLLAALCVAGVSGAARAQGRRAAAQEESEFGPVVRAYLGYLRAQQEVVDDRVSRREITRAYYVRNLNRIRSLKQMAMRIARETENDYLPELESVALDEFGLLFDEPPKPESLRVGETLGYTFRYLGTVRSGAERFYLFARLDPYEQAELQKKGEAQTPHANTPAPVQSLSVEPPTSRPRRVNQP